MSVTGLAQAVVQSSSPVDWALVAVAILVLAVAVFHFFARGRASTEARAGLALGLRGLLGKELRSRSRGWRPVWVLSGYLALLALAVVGFLGLMSMAGALVSPTVGPQIFSALGIGAVLLLAFITPALTVGAISGERERRTLDLLIVTGASPLGLAGGKLAASLSYVLFLLSAALPAFALVYLFAGVPAIYLILVLAVAVMTALAHASLGLLLSALLRRTLVASVVAYLLVLFLVFGLPVVSVVTGLARQSGQGGPRASGTPPFYLYASPLTSVSSALPAGPQGQGVPLIGGVMRVALMGGSTYDYGLPTITSDLTRAAYVVAIDETTGQPRFVTRLAPWVYNFVFSGLLALFCLAGTALLLAPVKRIRRVRSDA